jgi:hypothetical protein
MNRVTSNIGKLLCAWAALLLSFASGCGPIAAPPKKDPAPQTKVVEPPAVNQVEKKVEPKTAPPDEKPALPPPMLVAPAGPAEPGVNAKQGAAIPISFDDLALSLPMGKAFEESLLTPRAKELVGKQVAIRGYMWSELTTSTLTRFPFLRNPECPFGPGANAEHVIDVQMEGETTTQYTTQPVTVIGILTAEPYIGDDGTAWAIFRIVARRVQR